jgi:hypothetical protein
MLIRLGGWGRIIGCDNLNPHLRDVSLEQFLLLFSSFFGETEVVAITVMLLLY